ncbi:MAG TPA: hypothetical protein PK014_04935 [Thermoanaerobaculia bacterium]|nr:hypothetical protein [Thermoanaerobaculia bacterium]HUM29505.1 hypothetical protein [Thermoanaerobaculia bacterium]HXK67888.1 hypothetical protein [Thermoanaerobaculia bacterium]
MEDLIAMARWVVHSFLAFFISFLPERWKMKDPLSSFSSAPAHALSGVLEACAGAGLLFAGLIAHVEGFISTSGYDYVVTKDSTTYGELFGIGAFGYLAFFLKPQSWILLYFFLEGIVRALEASFTGRHLGIFPLWMVDQIWTTGQEGFHSFRLKRKIGPQTSDEIVTDEKNPDRGIDLYSSELKPWSDVQVVEYGERHYILLSTSLVQRKDRYAYRYRFRPLADNELIRGSIVRVGEPETPSGS